MANTSRQRRRAGPVRRRVQCHMRGNPGGPRGLGSPGHRVQCRSGNSGEPLGPGPSSASRTGEPWASTFGIRVRAGSEVAEPLFLASARFKSGHERPRAVAAHLAPYLPDMGPRCRGPLRIRHAAESPVGARGVHGAADAERDVLEENLPCERPGVFPAIPQRPTRAKVAHGACEVGLPASERARRRSRRRK